MQKKPSIEIQLTPEQQAQLGRQTGKEITTLKLEALETRLAPALTGN